MFELILVGILSFYIGYSMTPDQRAWLENQNRLCPEQQRVIDKIPNQK